MKAWKAFEQAAAALFNGKRFWANSGERLDFEGEIYGYWPDDRTNQNVRELKAKIRGQCKLVKTLSLEALTQLAEEKDVDVVVVKRRRGRGKPSPMLVVFTAENYRRFHSDTTSSTPTVARCASSAPSPTSRLSENTSRLPSGPSPFSGLSGLGYSSEMQRYLLGRLGL